MKLIAILLLLSAFPPAVIAETLTSKENATDSSYTITTELPCVGDIGGPGAKKL